MGRSAPGGGGPPAGPADRGEAARGTERPRRPAASWSAYPGAGPGQFGGRPGGAGPGSARRAGPDSGRPPVSASTSRPPVSASEAAGVGAGSEFTRSREPELAGHPADAPVVVAGSEPTRSPGPELTLTPAVAAGRVGETDLSCSPPGPDGRRRRDKGDRLLWPRTCSCGAVGGELHSDTDSEGLRRRRRLDRPLCGAGVPGAGGG